jgi:hypothetical protein
MPAPGPTLVLTPAEASRQLGAILRRFREEGVAARAVLVGANGQPEAVIVSYELYAAATAQHPLK